MQGSVKYIGCQLKILIEIFQCSMRIVSQRPMYFVLPFIFFPNQPACFYSFFNQLVYYLFFIDFLNCSNCIYTSFLIRERPDTYTPTHSLVDSRCWITGI